MDNWASPFGEVSLKQGEISLTGMKISPYKHSQVGWPECWDESSRISIKTNSCLSPDCPAKWASPASI